MRQIRLIQFLCLFIICGLSGISLADSAVKNMELTRSSVVVVKHPGFHIDKKTSFTWIKDHADISGKFKKSEMLVEKMIDSAILRTISEKGYKFDSENAGSLLIHYHISLESEMDDMTLAIRYGLAPGLRSNHQETQKYERGTLVLDIIDPLLRKVVWRGAIGAFTGLENTDEGRQKRVNQILSNLMLSIPARTSL